MEIKKRYIFNHCGQKNNEKYNFLFNYQFESDKDTSNLQCTFCYVWLILTLLIFERLFYQELLKFFYIIILLHL